MKYKVDVVRIRENSITLNGWALGKSPESKVTFRVEDEHHQPVKCKMVSTRRDDVSQIYFKKVIDRELVLISSFLMSGEKLLAADPL